MADAKTKLCSECGLDRPFEQFRSDKRRSSGLSTECGDCHRKRYPDADRQKVCTKCFVEKSVADFPPRVGRASGLQSQCRECRAKYNRFYRNSVAPLYQRAANSRNWYRDNIRRGRDTALRWKYGISIEDFDAMAEAQGNLCKLCGKPDAKILKVDHCHATGKIRGLLCSKCNTGLGLLGDTEESLRLALDYLAGTT